MSQRSRSIKRLQRKRRKIFILSTFAVVALIYLVGSFINSYRSNRTQIIEQTDYKYSVGTELYYLKDVNYLIVDNFSAADLVVSEGTKVSGYENLTNSAIVINQDYLNTQIDGINRLLNENIEANWDQYTVNMTATLSSSELLSGSELDFYKNTSRYSPLDRAKLEEDRNFLQNLNTGAPINLTLDTYGIMKTGFVSARVNEYQMIANESVLGSLSIDLLNDISRLSTDETTALTITNNDHCYAVCTVSSDTLVQDEDLVNELKQTYHTGSNMDYFNMLITRIDILRDYPTISFNRDGRDFETFLVDVIPSNDKKILVLMIKDYIQDMLNYNKIDCQLYTQDYPAWIVPQSSIIQRDGKTYVETLERGYFVEEKEVNISLYDKGQAILPVYNNPNLDNGVTIKVFP